jgi:hypothetical protein
MQKPEADYASYCTRAGEDAIWARGGAMVPWAGKRLRTYNQVGKVERLRFMGIGRGCGFVVMGRAG